MTEHPILFAGRLVRAIFAGRKTQTRRLVRLADNGAHFDRMQPFPDGSLRAVFENSDGEMFSVRCPFGEPGHRLWVRETWLELDKKHWGDPGLPREAVYNHPLPRVNACAYAADTERGGDGDDARRAYGYRWKPSIHMPRWASRITLEVTGIRVERLQAITEEDAKAEGVTMVPFYPDDGFPLSEGHMLGANDGASPLHATRVEAFATAWDSINGERGAWASNPWVWVVSFKPIAIARAA